MDCIQNELYRIFYHIVVYIIAFRSLIDEMLYKFGFKRPFDVKEDLTQDLTGKVAIVTGGTRGIGMTVVRELIIKGCFVFVASSQTQDKFPQILEKIYSDLSEKDEATGIRRGTVRLHNLDLTQMNSVKEFAKSFKNSKLSLNYLICNAGIMFAPRSITIDGFESHLAVNYLGHCLLIMELLALLIKTADETKSQSRIINVSSSTHKVSDFDFDDLTKQNRYSSAQAYGQSKLAQIMFSSKLSRVLRDALKCDRVQVFCVHPGVVLSDLYEHVSILKVMPFLVHLIKLVTRDVIQGAETTLYAALSRELDGVSGEYLEDCDFKQPSRASRNIENQERLWTLTNELLDKWSPPSWKKLTMT